MSITQYFMTFLVLIGCSTSTAAELATPRIEFEHFSFSSSPIDTWKVVEKSSNHAVFTTSHGQGRYRITIIGNDILDPQLRASTAKDVADDFRYQEKYGMMEFGVKQGMYELRDLTMGDEQIGNKVFYTMKYATFHPQTFQSARLYLYFPFEKNNHYFLIGHYSEAAPNQASLKHSYVSNFMKLLTTVSHREK